MKELKSKVFMFLWLMYSILTLGLTKLGDWIYYIKKGNNKCEDRRLHKTKGDITFSFIFDEQHRYLHEVKSDHINKLFGLSTFKINENSAGIGWRQLNDNEFELLAYWYIDGKMKSKVIYIAAMFEMLWCEVFTKEGFIFMVNDKDFAVKEGKLCKYVTFPDFGDVCKSPHDMYFDIKVYY